MHEKLNKQISEFLDDELNQHEALSLLKKMKADPELKNKLYRFEIISHALKSEAFIIPDRDFSTKVSEAIGKEPVYLLPQSKKSNNARKIVAAAASVAVLAVIVGSRVHQPMTETQTASVMQNTVNPPDPPIALARQPQKQSINQRINEYLQAHNSSVYTNGQANFQPYARVTAYGQR